MEDKLIESLEAKLWRIERLATSLLPKCLGNGMPIMEAREIMKLAEEGRAELEPARRRNRPEPSQVVRSSELLDLLAGWRAAEQACEEQGSGLLKTTQTQVALEYCTKAETWRRAIAGLERVVGGLASKSNDLRQARAAQGVDDTAD